MQTLREAETLIVSAQCIRLSLPHIGTTVLDISLETIL
jgi:hypothetical protein